MSFLAMTLKKKKKEEHYSSANISVVVCAQNQRPPDIGFFYVQILALIFDPHFHNQIPDQLVKSVHFFCLGVLHRRVLDRSKPGLLWRLLQSVL